MIPKINPELSLYSSLVKGETSGIKLYKSMSKVIVDFKMLNLWESDQWNSPITNWDDRGSKQEMFSSGWTNHELQNLPDRYLEINYKLLPKTLLTK